MGLREHTQLRQRLCGAGGRVDGHFLYGELMSRGGDTEKARNHYEKALKINPQAEKWVKPRLEKLEAR